MAAQRLCLGVGSGTERPSCRREPLVGADKHLSRRIEQLAQRTVAERHAYRERGIALLRLSPAAEQRLVRLLARADRTWLDSAIVVHWVQELCGAFGGRTPADLGVGSDAGLHRAIDVVRRIDREICS